VHVNSCAFRKQVDGTKRCSSGSIQCVHGREEAGTPLPIIFRECKRETPSTRDLISGQELTTEKQRVVWIKTGTIPVRSSDEKDSHSYISERSVHVHRFNVPGRSIWSLRHARGLRGGMHRCMRSLLPQAKGSTRGPQTSPSRTRPFRDLYLELFLQ
jgi:hypothetical protein